MAGLKSDANRLQPATWCGGAAAASGLPPKDRWRGRGRGRWHGARKRNSGFPWRKVAQCWGQPATASLYNELNPVPSSITPASRRTRSTCAHLSPPYPHAECRPRRPSESASSAMARSSVFIASLDGDGEVPVLTTSLTYLESAGPSLTNKLQCCRRAPSVGHEINETWADN